MSAKNSFETELLELIFQNENVGNIGDATGIQGASTAGNLYVALFTVAPTDSTQGTECNYTGYARVAVARSAVGWTVSGDSVSNAAAITFGECSAGSNTVVAFAICKGGTVNTNDAILYGTLTASLAVSAGVTPEFAIGALEVTVD